MNTLVTGSKSLEGSRARFMSKVYQWMTLGLLTTSLVSYYIGTNEQLFYSLVGGRFSFIMLFVVQIALVMGLSAFIDRMSAMVATLMFFLYSVVTGVTLSAIFMIYTQGTLMSAFATTTAGFLGLSFVGMVTKKDLGPIGTFCMMGVWGMIGFAILSMIFPSLMASSSMQMIYSVVGLLLFSGLTAYDTQKIKSFSSMAHEDSEESFKLAILGALTLYLDFINLFLFVLRIMGGGRRD